jgi:hypothetical protein
MPTFINAIGFWLSMAVGAAAYAWPQLLLRSNQRFTEDQLRELSPNFQGLTRTILLYDIFTFLLTMAGLLATLTLPIQQNPAGMQAARLTWPAVLLSFLGLMQGLFAAWRGVYPASRYRGRRAFFAYEEGDRMKTLGKQQIILALAVIILALLVGWLRWQAG